MVKYMAYRKLEIDFDKIYQSNFCGPFKIIEDLGRDSRSRRHVKIQFLYTGTEKDVRYDIAMAGKVNDDLHGIDTFQVYDSLYYGKYYIVDFVGRDESSKKIVRIRFMNTGYEYNVYLRAAIRGDVKDYSVSYQDRKSPSKESPNYDDLIFKILKGRWKGMMDRCYNPNNYKYGEYGGAGVTVCELWQTLEGYVNSIPSVRNYELFYNNPENYQLDKDYLQQNIPTNQRVYSPETCIFLSNIDNANLSMKEKYDDSYYGIKEENGNYQVKFSVNGTRYIFGTYSNLQAAVNEYNYYYNLYSPASLIPLLNKVENTMSLEEAMKYLVREGNFDNITK